MELTEIINECPAQSAIGVVTTTVNEPGGLHFATFTTPIFNMTPLPGEPARFAFKAGGVFPVFLDVKVRSGSDYGVTVTASNITEIAWTLSAKPAFWSVPGVRCMIVMRAGNAWCGSRCVDGVET
jgi:hypothetical protein